jgi:type II secretory pathway component PulC
VGPSGTPMRPAASVAFALALLAPGVSAQQPADALPSSALPLRLVGVLRALSRPTRSGALVQCGSPQERRPAWLVFVGERACDVAEITEVFEERVVIRNLRTGRLEMLPLVGATTQSAPAHVLPTRVPASAEADPLPPPLVLPGAEDVVNVELRQDVIDRYMANLPEALSSALATPHHATGSNGPGAVDGYEMSRIKTGGIVDQLGLRDGDVLMEFNGQRLDSLAAVTALLTRAQALDGARMTVLRRSRTLTFVFSVR